MNRLQLPPKSGELTTPLLPKAKQLSIIGGGAAGKTKFMEELKKLNQGRAYCLSALSAPYPEREESELPGSIDMQFRKVAADRPYMKTDAVSELDKLIYMLFIDEFEYLLTVKEMRGDQKDVIRISPTKIDKIADVWERVFPGNKIVRTKGDMRFSTMAGNDLISVEKLSQGEQAVLYYSAAVLYAPEESVVFIDTPSLFLHPTLLGTVWNSIEGLRPDCTFVYNSVDVNFVTSRTRNVSIWVKSYEAEANKWDYEIIPPGKLHEDIFVDLIGSRKPVLFIEGDVLHSIDSRLYPLVFPDYTVKPLGSCDKVIETTRSFNDQKNLHHLQSMGIVDRDRRTDPEVEYLRRKNIMVPNVAEIENIFLLEGVVRTMAAKRGKDPERVFSTIKKRIVKDFKNQLERQVLQHIRHRVKREVECKIDAKFSCITAMESHLRQLPGLLAPRKQYNELRNIFLRFAADSEYGEILKVFNHKPMLSECGIAELLGYHSKEDYIDGVLNLLKNNSHESNVMRNIIRQCFNDGNPEDMVIERRENSIPERRNHRKKRYRRKRNRDESPFGSSRRRD